jgi:hypothetical protein
MPAITIAFIVIVVLATGLLIFLKQRTHTASTYEAADGTIYHCSRPVKVKNQGVSYGNGTPSLTPIDPTEASKFCQPIGVE